MRTLYDPKCPHCRAQVNTDWEALQGMCGENFNYEDSRYEVQCASCNQWFVLNISLVADFDTEQEICELCDDDATELFDGQWFCRHHKEIHENALKGGNP